MTEAGRITAIEREERGLRVVISVDGAPWLTVHRDVALEAGLRRGDPAGDALRERLWLADETRRAYDAALQLLSYRPRAEVELRRRLERKGAPEQAIDAALERLRRAGLVNDEQFARAWVANRGSGAAGKGRARLAAELHSKGVASEVVREAVEAVDEREQAIAVARARAARLRGLEYQEFRRRLAGFLQRRGYGYDAVSAAIRAAWADVSGTEDTAAVDEIE